MKAIFQIQKMIKTMNILLYKNFLILISLKQIINLIKYLLLLFSFFNIIYIDF